MIKPQLYVLFKTCLEKPNHNVTDWKKGLTVGFEILSDSLTFSARQTLPQLPTNFSLERVEG